MERHSFCFKQKLRRGILPLYHITEYRHGCWTSVWTLLVLLLLFLALLCMFISFLLHISTPRFSPPPPQPPVQVFINFRGEDLRYGFVSHLGEALRRHHINFFIDKHEERGKDLKALFKRIEESTIALAIVSTRYAESGWCLDELVKIMERVRMEKLRVIPIFIKVKTRDVKEQKGDFGRRFWKLARSSRGEQIMKWKQALCSVTTKTGLALGYKSYENDFIKEIVMAIERVLTAKWEKTLYDEAPHMKR